MKKSIFIFALLLTTFFASAQMRKKTGCPMADKLRFGGKTNDHKGSNKRTILFAVIFVAGSILLTSHSQRGSN